jgi:glucose/arabinose dehydrogenase
MLFVGASLGCEEGDPVDPETQPFEGSAALQLVAQGLISPVTLAQPPDGSGRLFVVDQIGRIRIVDAAGQLLQQPFLDISARLVPLNPAGDERGLLGLAFHPQYATNRRFFVYYSAPRRASAPTNFSHTNQVTEFTTSDDPDRANPTSERIVLQVDQPQSNHDGGTIAFGPDGYLYVSLGDGGGANDTGTGHSPEGNGQDLTNLLGSILRISLDVSPYGIPFGNPFAGTPPARPEIWAYGFRNPYRFSFDRSTGELIVGDVGQNRWEEVDLVRRGRNYGWNIKEGRECFNRTNASQPLPSCPFLGANGQPLFDPVLVYPNSRHSAAPISGVAVVGGYVYRGRGIPGLEGHYVFGDFSGPQGGLLMVAATAGEGPWTFERLDLLDRPGGMIGHLLKGFGEDRTGEIYLLTSDQGGPTGSSGRVYRLVATPR